MRVIQRGDIIGRRLVRVVALSTCDGGMDVCDCLIVLDSGLVFRLPAFSDEPFLPSEPPAGALPVQDPRLRDVCGATIVGLLRPRLDDDFLPGSVVLALSTGKWITHEAAAPHGLGAAGLHILNEGDVWGPDLIDFWQGNEAEPGIAADRPRD
jgi:hypothetical protein